MAEVIKMATVNTETDVAVLQVQVQNIEEKIGELKEDVKDLADNIDKNNEATKQTLKDMQVASTSAHKAMDDKISSLEKWRRMMMGAGVVLGALGHNMFGSLLK